MDFERLARVINSFGDIELLVAEIKACNEDVQTVDELAEYLEDELEYAGE